MTYVKLEDAVAICENDSYFPEEGAHFAEALRSLPTDDGWEDIAINPPPANEVVLMCLYHGHWEVWEYEAGCYETGQRIGGYSNVHFHGQATHWRPLPAPPAC